MMTALESLINSLREELQHYGEMLAVLDQQQEVGRMREADDILSSISVLNRQSAAIQSARALRATWQQQLATALQQNADADFVELIPLLPAPYRPLLTALVHENNELLVRVRTRARENQILLNRSLEMMQRFVSTLTPPNSSACAESEQTDLITAASAAALYEAIA